MHVWKALNLWEAYALCQSHRWNFLLPPVAVCVCGYNSVAFWHLLLVNLFGVQRCVCILCCVYFFSSTFITLVQYQFNSIQFNWYDMIWLRSKTATTTKKVWREHKKFPSKLVWFHIIIISINESAWKRFSRKSDRLYFRFKLKSIPCSNRLYWFWLLSITICGDRNKNTFSLRNRKGANYYVFNECMFLTHITHLSTF